MRRILVTGATGRLGAATVRRLTDGGFEVRAVSRRPREGAVEWVVADLTTGEGVAAAVEGVEAVVHLAAAPYKGRYTDRVELDGTRALAGAAAKAGVRHLLYVSIVGVEAVPWGYFMTKLKGERIVAEGGVPYSIVRATQFHEFVDGVFARLPLLLVDAGISAQPVDVREVAARLVDRVGQGPSGGIEEFGGPEVLTMTELAERWRAARGVRRPIVRVRVPGRLGRAFRAGHATTRALPSGTIGWGDYLEGH
ncbi:SDR family oxidoreductase [Nonomuraea dietziae]|uniref:Uncharacterized protein YbjT (DUF2867 family) n=1 Tax=Nonomuraea dietziae TaxID=65515 RepID=A0A7W5V1P7_9ACTN|nr:NAD(P)H-binding protein [Nonomuraea dietziae]MBB3727169.1 uncharacterized protein YbjT (DUF2867 family) [Nonomuraea dietziae]